MQIDEHVLLHGFVKAKASSGLRDIGVIFVKITIFCVFEISGVKIFNCVPFLGS